MERPNRLVGVDVARGLALVLMMAAHIVPSAATGLPGLVHDISGGRASALFAVLAGLSLALVTGRGTPPTGADRRVARLNVVGRALAIGALGLTLGVADSGVAVILVNYAVLFLVATPFLGLRARALAVWAVAWLVVTPPLGMLLRPEFAQGPGPVPSWLSLEDPQLLLETLLLTGYYPVLQWTGYLLVGLAVGRSRVVSAAGSAAGRRAALVLAGSGAVLAVGAKVVSRVLLDGLGGREHLTIPPTSPVAGRSLDEVLTSSMYGTTPSTSWWWLAASGPHEASWGDLAHTTGTALLTIGVCLLVVPVLTRSAVGAALLRPLGAAGAMTLTLYSLHVVALSLANAVPGLDVLPANPGALWLLHVCVALLVATAWRTAAQKGGLSGVGPAEFVARGAGRSLADAGRP